MMNIVHQKKFDFPNSLLYNNRIMTLKHNGSAGVSKTLRDGFDSL